MEILKYIKSFFKHPGSVPAGSPYPPYDIEAYIKNHLITVEEKGASLREKYGEDFNAFLYRPDLDEFIRGELHSFLDIRPPNDRYFDDDHWNNKHPFNFPGPFYTGESDTCGTGDGEAPFNVLYDSYCCEYVFRQPKTYGQLLCVMDAAAVEVFDSYSCNGNAHWTYNACKEWWSSRFDLIAQLNTPEVKRANGERVHLYLDYLSDGAEIDLRRYCYFLESGHYPDIDVNELPEL